MGYSMRRRILKMGLVGLSSFLFWGRWLWAETGKLKLIDMEGKVRQDAVNQQAVNIAKGLNYVADAKSADKAGQIKRQAREAHGVTVPGEKQICGNCNFFDQKVKAGEPGACMLIPGVLVHYQGWCNTWVLHPQQAKEFKKLG